MRLADLGIIDQSDPNFHYGKTATAYAQPFGGLVYHHTADKPLDALVRYGKSVDTQRGGAFGYHFYVGKDGQIVQGAPLEKRTNHIKPPSHKARKKGVAGALSNANALGVTLVGAEHDATPQQIAAAEKLGRALMAEYNIPPEMIYGHGMLQRDRQHTEGAELVSLLQSGDGFDSLMGGEKGDIALEDVQAEIRRRRAEQSAPSIEDVRAEIAKRKVAAEGPSQQDRIDVEHALSQIEQGNQPEAQPERRKKVRRFTGGDILLQAMGGDPLSASKEARQFGDMIFQGLLAEFGDEVMAGGNWLAQVLAGKETTYDDEVAIQREGLRATEEQSPAAAMLGKGVGALATGAGLGGGGVTLLKGGAGLVPNVGRGIAEGAAYGAAYGAGAADGESRTEGALKGAALGGAVGGALPVVGAALRQIPVGARTVKNLLGLQGDNKTAARLLQRALDEDGALKAAIPGKPDTIMDLAGDNTRRLAQTARAVPSEGGSRLTQMLEERVAGQGNRIIGDAADFLGATGRKFFQTTQDIIEKRAKQVGPIYEKLRTKGMPITDDLADLVDRPAMQTALRRAAGTLKNATGKNVDLDGTEVPFALLDQAKKEIDDMIRGAQRDPGSAGKFNVTGLIEVKKSLLGIMDGQFKGYARARKVFSDDASILDAMEAGRTFMRGDVDEMAAMFKDMSKAEQEAFRLGVARQIREIVEKTPDTADAARKLMNNEAVRQRLQVVSSDDMRLRRFMSGLMRENQYAVTRKDVTGGSPTYPRQAAADAALGGIETVATGGVSGALRVVKDIILARGKGINKATASKLSEMLSSNDVDGVMQWLQTTQGRKLVNDNLHHMDAETRKMILRAASGSLGAEDGL